MLTVTGKPTFWIRDRLKKSVKLAKDFENIKTLSIIHDSNAHVSWSTISSSSGSILRKVMSGVSKDKMTTQEINVKVPFICFKYRTLKLSSEI